VGFAGRIIHDGRIKQLWPVYVFLAAMIIYACYELIERFVPTRALPPLAERLAEIRKNVQPDDFSFAVIGDSKDDKKVFPEILSRINDDPSIAFVIHLGDAVEDPDRQLYQEFLETIETFLHKPILLVPGNHDVSPADGGLYERHFGPKQYAFTIGRARFVIANTEDGPLSLLSEPGRRWLRDELDKSGSNRPVLLFMHHPLFDPRGNGLHHCLQPAASGRLLAIFSRYRVDHIFAGHVHGYWKGAWNNIPYTVSGGGGAMLAVDKPSHGLYHFFKIRIKEGRIDEETVPVQETRVTKSENEFVSRMKIEPFETALLTVMLCCILAMVLKGIAFIRHRRKTR